MRIVILGADGRAVALGKRFVRDGHLVLFSPGSAACSLYGECTYTPSGHIDLIVNTSLDERNYDLIDKFPGVPVYSVPRDCLRIESDRGYASAICEACGIATPSYCAVSVEEAEYVVRKLGKPFVVKWDTLVGGTNVSVCISPEDTLCEIGRAVTEKVMLQEIVHGVEVSFTVSIGTNGEAVGLCTVFEHKRMCDGDLGPMTAEMGSLILAGVSDKGMELYRKLQPALKNTGYVGMLDINCMLNVDTGVLWFIEFTARFGDPTTEIWVPMIKEDLGRLLLEWACGNMVKPKFNFACGIGVVIAGGGYPFPYQVKQGLPIVLSGSLLNNWEHNVSMSIMSADVRNRALYSNGGRQLIWLGYGGTAENARDMAYRYEGNVLLRDMFYRKDIGLKWIQGEREVCIRHGIVEDGMGGFSCWQAR